MRRAASYVLISLLGFTLSCSQSQTTGDKLRLWRQGVWLLSDGSYAIYTENHYFVVSASGDSSRANVYCGASEMRITNAGIARRQTLRIRKFPDGNLTLSKVLRESSDPDHTILEIDMTQFQPGVCNTDNDIIYDSVTEETGDFILLATCNGDMEKVFSDGSSVYLPASGGEFWAHRVESWSGP